MEDQGPTNPFVPKPAAAGALAALETLLSQDRMVRALLRPELEPITISGKLET